MDGLAVCSETIGCVHRNRGGIPVWVVQRWNRLCRKSHWDLHHLLGLQGGCTGKATLLQVCLSVSVCLCLSVCLSVCPVLLSTMWLWGMQLRTLSFSTPVSELQTLECFLWYCIGLIYVKQKDFENNSLRTLLKNSCMEHVFAFPSFWRRPMPSTSYKY